MKLKIFFFLGLLCSLKLLAQDIPFRLMHTNDLHSHLEGSWKINQAGTPIRMGHYARLIYEIDQRRQEAKQKSQATILVDAGDFFAGTIFHTLAPWDKVTEFPEWEYFSRAGYDAVILGNHEFDPGNRGFSVMLSKIEGGPQLVSTNIVLPKDFEGSKVLKSAIKEISYQSHKINVGILGILPPDGCLVSKASRENIRFVGFEDSTSKAKWSELEELLANEIQKLKKQAQVVILVMHGGNPEDERLASNLKDVDFIIAGHTHRVYGHTVSGVPISQAGDFGSHLGSIDLSYSLKEKKLRVLSPEADWIQPIFSNGAKDPEFEKRIDHFKKLAKLRFGARVANFEQILFTPTQNYLRAREVNNQLGVFVTSHIRQSLNTKIKDPVDIYFTSMGLIRSSFIKDIPYSFPDLFEMLSVGFAADGSPGAEISIFKLTPNDIEKVIGFMELYSNFSNSFAPAFSDSLSFKVRKWGIPFINRIYDIKVHGVDLDEMDQPITVATNMIVAKNVDMVTQKTYGLVSITPLGSDLKPKVPIATTLPKEFELLSDAFLEFKTP
tara:strand:+ start:10645 stop:12303 length:1659 start_codon:yes stop_codon:yes gene_type:complete